MSLQDMLRDGSLQSFEATPEEIQRSLEVARRDLALTDKVLVESVDWAYSIAYNAVLQACRAYMFSLGYRPASAVAHKTTFEFMRLVSDQSLQSFVSYFDRVRRKRHRVIYDEVGAVSQTEARELVRRARQFLALMERKLSH